MLSIQRAGNATANPGQHSKVDARFLHKLTYERCSPGHYILCTAFRVRVDTPARGQLTRRVNNARQYFGTADVSAPR